MKKIRILAVDSVKSPFWKEAAQTFLTRISPFAKVMLTEIAAEPLTASKTESFVLESEGERLLAALPKMGRKIVLDPKGKSFTSEAFADYVEQHTSVGDELIFIIGGTFGVSPRVTAACEQKLSLSAMTFPHEMARVMLLEQLYRACTIVSGKKYHH